MREQEIKPAQRHDIGNSMTRRGRCPWSRLSREGACGKRKSQRFSLFLRHGLANEFGGGSLPHGTQGTVRWEGPCGPLGIRRSVLDAVRFSISGKEGSVGAGLGTLGCDVHGSASTARGIYSFAFLLPSRFFLPLTQAFRGATNRRKRSSLVVSLLTNCKVQSRVRPQTCLAGQAC